MKTIRVIECECGEDVYEDDKDESGQLRCISCYKAHEPSELKEVDVAEIMHEKREMFAKIVRRK